MLPCSPGGHPRSGILLSRRPWQPRPDHTADSTAGLGGHLTLAAARGCPAQLGRAADGTASVGGNRALSPAGGLDAR